MATDHARYNCGDIHTHASVETLKTYEENLPFYETHNYTYVPLPVEMQYYDRKAGELKDLAEGQFIDVDAPLLEGLAKLRDYPFVLTRDTPSYGYTVEGGELEMVGMVNGVNIHDLAESHPEHLEQALHWEEEKRWGIITLGDANRRAVRASLYIL